MLTSLLRSAGVVAAFGLAASVAAAQSPTAALLVADPQAGAVHVYDAPGFGLRASFNGVTMDTHAGAVVLDDGRVLVADRKAQELVVLDLGAETPRIARRIAMPAAEGAHFGWSAADEEAGYYVATSDDHESAVEVLSIVDLDEGTVTQLDVDTGAPDAELGVVVGGEPATVVLHLSDRAESYPLDRLVGAARDALTRGAVKPTSTIPVGPGGHGNSISAGKWAGSTERGMELATLEGSALVDPKVVPWDVDGRTGGQNYRQRLTADGTVLFGPVLAAPEPEKWAEGEVDLHWVTLADGAAKRTPLGKGLVGRGGVSATLAAYANIGGEGDVLHLVDIAPASPAFGQVVASVPLDKLKDGPVSGEPAKGKEGRYAGITPDGRFAFATHGGEGKISVVDVEKRAVAQTISTPTPLKGGGYLVAVQPGAPVEDKAGR